MPAKRANDMSDRWIAVPLFLYGLWLFRRPEDQWWLSFGWATDKGNPTRFSLNFIRFSGVLAIVFAVVGMILGFEH